MDQKVLKVGTSAAVTLSKKTLEDLGLRIGDSVVIDGDKTKKIAIIKPISYKRRISNNDKIAKLTLDFIKRYRKDLESLAGK